MGSKPPAPKEPQKTLKEFIEENCKEIGNMRRQFNRDCMKLEYQNKKMSKDLKKLIKDNGATVTKKTLAQNILKNERMVKKYKDMDAQLQNTIFQLRQMNTMDQMSNVMSGMANIMGKANGKLKVQNFQKTMVTYQTEKERMEIMNEMIQDGMEMDDEIDDADVNNLIANMENDFQKKKMQQAQQEMEYEEEN